MVRGLPAGTVADDMPEASELIETVATTDCHWTSAYRRPVAKHLFLGSIVWVGYGTANVVPLVKSKYMIAKILVSRQKR